jgi:hypothetical protein
MLLNVATRLIIAPFSVARLEIAIIVFDGEVVRRRGCCFQKRMIPNRQLHA